MAAVINSDILHSSTEIQVVDRLAESNGSIKTPDTPPSKDQIKILQYSQSFAQISGYSPTHALLLSSASTSNNPFFHEACVYLPAHEELYTTSNLLQSTSSAAFPTILISRIKLHRSPSSSSPQQIHTVEWAKLRPPPNILMPNGGTNYKSGILFCSQGSEKPSTGGLYYMPRASPPLPLITNFHGREFNSVNDVVVCKKDGSIWFTDPSYGWEQDFRPKPKLPNQVYRFDPASGDVRVVADGMGMPNGLCFSPDEEVLYITDTDAIHAEGNTVKILPNRPSTIYAYDIILRSGAPFLANRRVFAFAAAGFPDGIKCDTQGNVYSGCGDGVEVWNPAGTLIGRILVPGGVANFCFGKDGEMFLCAETKLWRLQLAATTKGALLNT